MNNLGHFGRTPRTGNRPIARPFLLAQYSTTQERWHLCMLPARFKPKIPAS